MVNYMEFTTQGEQYYKLKEENDKLQARLEAAEAVAETSERFGDMISPLLGLLSLGGKNTERYDRQLRELLKALDNWRKVKEGSKDNTTMYTISREGEVRKATSATQTTASDCTHVEHSKEPRGDR